MKRISVFTRAIAVGAIALSVSANISAGQAKQAPGSQPSLEAMEHHWQSVINERDTARRQVLIQEHRRMMAEAQSTAKNKGAPSQAGKMGTMMQDPMHRDLQNTIEMHSIMLDMMK